MLFKRVKESIRKQDERFEKVIEHANYCIMEGVAATQHEIWAHWMKYLFTTGTQNENGSYTIPAENVARWKRQMNTDYYDLSEQEKESDRHMAQIVAKNYNNG